MLWSSSLLQTHFLLSPTLTKSLTISLLGYSSSISYPKAPVIESCSVKTESVSSYLYTCLYKILFSKMMVLLRVVNENK